MTVTTGQPAPETGTHHFVLTVQTAVSGGADMLTFTGLITPQPGQTRAWALEALREEIARSQPRYRGANVVLFALERNEL